jgi:hypothetical protein
MFPKAFDLDFLLPAGFPRAKFQFLLLSLSFIQRLWFSLPLVA